MRAASIIHKRHNETQRTLKFEKKDNMNKQTMPSAVKFLTGKMEWFSRSRKPNWSTTFTKNRWSKLNPLDAKKTCMAAKEPGKEIVRKRLTIQALLSVVSIFKNVHDSLKYQSASIKYFAYGTDTFVSFSLPFAIEL